MAKKQKPNQSREFDNKEDVMKAIDDKFGNGAITLGAGPALDVPSISTGSASLDLALGVWGMPKGRIAEVYGPESSGKTTLCLSIIKECQKQGGVAAFVDAEHALDPTWASNIGVDIDNLMISQPSSGEEALSIVEMLAGSKQVDLIVVDSVAALIPQAEIDGEMGDRQIGAQAQLMSKAMRKLVSITNKSNCTIIFINQIRMKIGVMFGCLHGDTLINFVDGSALPIKDVVEKKIEGDVWCYDEGSNNFVGRKIIDWHNNGDVLDKCDFLSILLRGPGNGNGRMNICVTPNHRVLTDNGWAEAGDLIIGDRIMTKQKNILSGDSHCMRRKLPDGVDDCRECTLHVTGQYSTTYAEVVSIRTASSRQFRTKGKYDITVDGCHNYSAGGRHNGVIVHNSPETTPGGRALKFYSSIRLDIRRAGAIKKGDDNIGNSIKVKVVKNKVAPPFRQAEFGLYFGRDGYPSGIDYASSLVDIAVDVGIIKQQGSWYNYGEMRLGNGQENAYGMIRSNIDLMAEISDKVRAAFSPDGVDTDTEDTEDKDIEDKDIEDKDIEDKSDVLEDFEE